MRPKYLPVLAVLLTPATLFITFPLAVRYEHVTYLVPYISDSGALPPESCIFGQILNIIALLTGFIMYIRYRQVREAFKRHSIRRSFHINLISFWVGLAAVFGISLVANFQETLLLTVHVIGAFMVFGLGAVYMCLQTFLYYKLYHVMGGNLFINILRLILSIASVISFSIFAPFAIIAFGMYDGDSIQNWKNEDKGFKLHLISSITEWICASCVLIYVSMFKEDFEYVDLREPPIYLEDNFVTRVNH